MTPGATSATAAPRPITPGTYLQLRRIAAGIAPDALAISQDAVEAIEADVRAPTDIELQAMAWAFHFDDVVLIGLARGILSRLCRACGCSEFDPCVDDVCGLTCRWVERDLCSACADRARALPQAMPSRDLPPEGLARSAS